MGKSRILKVHHLPSKTPSTLIGFNSQFSTENNIKLVFTFSEDSLRESLWNLFVEFKKSGRLLKVKIYGEHDSRYALLTFRKSEDVDKALAFAITKSINGVRLKAEPYDGIINGKTKIRIKNNLINNKNIFV